MNIGVDVSKDTLAVSNPSGNIRIIPNNKVGITKLLKSTEKGSTIAMEATGQYHKLLADTAFSQGFRVVVFNPKDVLHYARSVSPRAKTDSVDAKVIANYTRVREDYHVYRPLSPELSKLKSLLRTRSLLVRNRVGIQNNLSASPDTKCYLQPALDGIRDSISKLDSEIDALAKTFHEYQLLIGIPGVGLVTGAYLLVSLSSGEFKSSDSFVAFLGLDIRIKQSGKMIGRSCLSKRGDPEGRRLMFLAAQTICRYSGPFNDLYMRYQSNGLSKIASAVAVARKLARTAWSIYTKQQTYCKERVLSQGVMA
jgi:transposase